MVILNFAHPLTDEQFAQVAELADSAPTEVRDIPSQIDANAPLPPQIARLVDGLQIEPRQWQSETWLVNPPSLNYSAVVLLAELHGRMGYFPPCLRLRPDPEALSPRFEVAEILNLHRVREEARTRRED